MGGGAGGQQDKGGGSGGLSGMIGDVLGGGRINLLILNICVYML